MLAVHKSRIQPRSLSNIAALKTSKRVTDRKSVFSHENKVLASGSGLLISIMKLIAMLFLLTVDMPNGFGNNDVDKPKRLMVKSGARAILPCGGLAVVQTGDLLTWFKEGRVIASYRVSSDYTPLEQYIIEEMRDEDAGTYRCRVITMDGPAKDYVVEVDVIVPPVNVSIRTDNNDNFEAGSPRVLACIVYGCVPSLNVTWHLGDTMLRPNVYKEVNRGNFTVSSLTFVPSLTDNGKELVCKVTNNYMTETFEDRVTISVGHRPMCIDSGFKTIGAIEGDTETLVCMVESDPEPEQFIWTFADGRTIYTSSKKVSGYENRYSSTLVWVPREDDFGPLYCRASNRFGEQKQPCTFSVISGGPPTTPECEIFWEDQETLKVRCDKNWDGGRPQTIHLEVKGPEGTRKVSRKGHELKVDSLRPGVNFTAELYASNSRGRSLTVQLALPGPPSANMPPEYSYTSSQAYWTVIVGYCMYGFLGLIVLSCCYGISQNSCRKFGFTCCSCEDGIEETFARNEEIEMQPPATTNALPNVSCLKNKNIHYADDVTMSGTTTCADFDDSAYVGPMFQPRYTNREENEGHVLPKQCVAMQLNTQPTTDTIHIATQHYYCL